MKEYFTFVLMRKYIELYMHILKNNNYININNNKSIKFPSKLEKMRILKYIYMNILVNM